jgi:hypothetical protein
LFRLLQYSSPLRSIQASRIQVNLLQAASMGSAKLDVQLEDFGNIFSLEGKVAVVTGGSRGLGLHAASGYVAHAQSELPRPR